MLRSQPSERAAPSVPDHTLLHVIGDGAYGEVWLARNVVGTLRAVSREAAPGSAILMDPAEITESD